MAAQPPGVRLELDTRSAGQGASTEESQPGGPSAAGIWELAAEGQTQGGPGAVWGRGAQGVLKPCVCACVCTCVWVTMWWCPW